MTEPDPTEPDPVDSYVVVLAAVDDIMTAIENVVADGRDPDVAVAEVAGMIKVGRRLLGHITAGVHPGGPVIER